MGAHFTPPEPAEMADVRRELEALLAMAGTVRHMRRELKAAAERGATMLDALDLPPLALDVLDDAIAALDALDDDTEAEDDGTAEDEPDDEDDGTVEPSLASPERHPSPSVVSWGAPYTARGGDEGQLRWADGAQHDGEAVNEDGDDLDTGEHDTADTELSCGWTAKVDQAHLGHAQDDHEETALERHGRGFVRAGEDDAEDDDPAEDSDSPERDDDPGTEDDPHPWRSMRDVWSVVARVAHV